MESKEAKIERIKRQKNEALKKRFANIKSNSKYWINRKRGVAGQTVETNQVMKFTPHVGLNRATRRMQFRSVKEKRKNTAIDRRGDGMTNHERVVKRRLLKKAIKAVASGKEIRTCL